MKESREETQNMINPVIPEEIRKLEIQVNNKLSMSSTNEGINLDQSKITVNNILHIMSNLTLYK